MKKLSYLVLLGIVVGISVVGAWRLRPIPKKLVKLQPVATGSVIMTGLTISTGGATSQSGSQTTIGTGVIKSPLVYTNKEYGFQITLPKGWEKYKAFVYLSDKKTQGFYPGLVGNIKIALPVRESNRPGVPDPDKPILNNYDNHIKGYAELFNILIWTPEGYQQEYKRCNPNPDPSCIGSEELLGKNKSYYFTYFGPQDMPTDLSVVRGSGEYFSKIVSTFKSL